MSTAGAAFRPQLERARRAWRGSPLPGFLAWWGGELRALLPVRWRQALGGGDDWFLLQHRGHQWHLRPMPASTTAPVHWDDAADPALQHQALRQALASVDPDDLRLALVVPAAAGLRRVLQLPLAARDNLQQVVGFEIDRQTPFRTEQVYVDAHEVALGAGEGRFAVELVAVPRSTIDPLLKQLADLGVRVDAVDLLLEGTSGETAGERLGVNLLPPDQRTARVRPRLRLNLILAAACVLLLGLTLGEWLQNRRVALDAMQAQVDAMRAQAQQVVSLRQQLQDNAGAAGFLTQRKRDAVPMLAVLQDLTTRLPDDAWLERLSVDSAGQIGFQGQAKQAARLVDALKDSKLIRDAGFQGSIQPDPNTGKERFYMVAQERVSAAASARTASRNAAASNGNAGDDAGDGR